MARKLGMFRKSFTGFNGAQAFNIAARSGLLHSLGDKLFGGEVRHFSGELDLVARDLPGVFNAQLRGLEGNILHEKMSSALTVPSAMSVEPRSLVALPVNWSLSAFRS